MAKNILKKSLALFAFVTLTAAMMVGCKKDDVKPDNPNNPDEPVVPENIGHFVYDGDTLKVNYVAVEDLGGLYVVAVDLSNGAQFSVLGTVNPMDAGAMPFADFMTILFGGEGIYGSYMVGEETDDMATGTLELKTVEDKNELTIEGTTMSGKTVSASFKGHIIDLAQPTGTGSISWNGNSYELNLAAVIQDQGMYNYSIANTNFGNYLDIFNNVPLTNGTYTISDSEEQVTNNDQTIAASVEILDQTGENTILDATATSGTVTMAISGNTYTIDMDAISSEGNIKAHYTGDMYVLYATKMMAKARKMMKK